MNPEPVTEFGGNEPVELGPQLGVAVTEMQKQGVDPECQTAGP